jgi:hypothetical protein
LRLEAVPFVVPVKGPLNVVPLKVRVPVSVDAATPFAAAMLNVGVNVLPLGEPVTVPLKD